MKARKSRSLRRVMVRVPGGESRRAYRKRMHSRAICGICGDVLKGVPRVLPVKMKNMAKTKKRPQRPYGGVLCSKCMRRIMVSKARSGLK